MMRAVVMLVLFTPGLLAQSVTGTLVGTARDATGIIAGAKIVVTNQGTGVTWPAATNQDGDYVVPNLPAGQYQVRAEHPGYRAINIENINLLLNATVRHDLQFEVGELLQTVEVFASAPVVQSETSSVSLVVDTQTIDTLPVNGRTLDTFIFTAAGNASSDSASNPKIGGSQHWGGSQFTINGVTVNDLGNGGSSSALVTSLATQPSLETIQEVKVESNNAKAEYGGSVAVSMLTKGGSNQFHGSAYEFNRNRALAANSFFFNSANVPRPPFNRNEFGASLGGPIVKNRTFFFVSYEGLQLRSSLSGRYSMPTAEVRQGDFTGYTAIRDPLTGTPFPDNKIPANRLDSRVLKILSFVPLPNLSGRTNNLATSRTTKLGINRASIRFDQKINDLNTLFVSFNYGHGDPYELNRNFPPTYGNYSNAGFTTKTASVAYTRILSPNMTNELRASYFVMVNARVGQNQNFDPSSIFPGLYTPLPSGGLPTFIVTGLTTIGDYGGSDPSPQITDQIGDTFSWVHGSHVTRAGIDIAISRLSTNPSVSQFVLGSYTFLARYTGNAVADMMLGLPASSIRSTVAPTNVIGQKRYSAYVQDDWKFSPRLTLNYGLRYELNTRPSERSGAWANVNLKDGTLVVRTEGGKLPAAANKIQLSLYPYKKSEDVGWGSEVLLPDHRNFAPRFGFAYRPFRDSKTVIRGGYGIFYDLIPVYQGIYNLGISNPPFKLTEVFNNGATKPNYSLDNPFVVTPTVTANPVLYAVPRQIRNPYEQQWNLTVERQLPFEVGMRISYIGNKVVRALYVLYELNQPVTQRAGDLQAMRPFQPWANIYGMMPSGKAFTNQMQVEATKRQGRGLFFTSSFTWTKSVNNVPQIGSPQNPYDPSQDSGLADNIRRFVFYTTASYELPFGPGKRFSTGNRMLVKLVGGWRLAAVATLRSGAPFTVSFSPTLSGHYANRADVVSSDFYPAEKTIARWFNPTAFAAPAPFTFGNSARNLLIGPGQKNLDFSLSKTTGITERIQAEFRADFFNLPNHPSFGQPAANVSVPSSMGVISSTTVDARTVQLGLKLRF